MGGNPAPPPDAGIVIAVDDGGVAVDDGGVELPVSPTLGRRAPPRSDNGTSTTAHPNLTFSSIPPARVPTPSKRSRRRAFPASAASA